MYLRRLNHRHRNHRRHHNHRRRNHRRHNNRFRIHPQPNPHHHQWIWPF